MPLKVLPATAEDAPRSVAIESSAYGPNPIGPILFPGPFPPNKDGVNPRAAQMVGFLKDDPACRWVKVVDTDIPDPEKGEEGEGQMVAFSMWYLWTEGEVEGKKREFGEGTNAEACELFFGGMKGKRDGRFRGKPFMYLKLLHTDPQHQRRGAGSMLLQWGAEEADRLGLDTYLEASPEGKPLYEKRGFKEMDTLETDFTKWGGPIDQASLMLRPVSK